MLKRLSLWKKKALEKVEAMKIIAFSPDARPFIDTFNDGDLEVFVLMELGL